MQKRGEFFDFDPLTGLEEYVEVTNDGMIHIHTYQDVEPIVNYCKALANEGLPDDNWNKNDVSVYAIIPAIVQLDLLQQKNINVMDQNDVGKVVREINTNYPYLKTTYKHHEVR
jgi:hypothetical protein